MGGIFISYRREDAAPWAGRLYERLARDFPRDQLFMDVDAIEPGLDFFTVLDDQVASCEALLAIIGPDWVEARNKQGMRRLDDPEDFVRIELSSALKRDIRVIPVLINGAPMPRADELPEALKPLARRHAIEVSHARFGSDTQGLVEVLQRVVTQPVVPSQTGWLGKMFGNAATPQRAPSPSKRSASSPHPQARDSGVALATPEMAKPPSSSETEIASTIHRPDAAPLRGASVASKPVVTASWGPVVVASVFALAALPTMKLMVELFNAMHWSWLGANGDSASACLASAMILVVSALALARLRGAALTGVEVGLYWLRSSLVVWFAIAELFIAMDWRLLGTGWGSYGSGFLAAATIVVMSALAMARLRGAALTGAEVGLYWLGSSLVVTLMLAWHFPTMGLRWLGADQPATDFSGLLPGAMLAAISGVILLIYFRRRSTV